jgi:phosphatidylglycerophosphate synthase
VTAAWLTAMTASRLLVCVPVFVWCWRRRPRGMVAWMTLATLAFVATDFHDGRIAREHGLESRLGHWLDRAGDVAGTLAMAAAVILGPRGETTGRRPRTPT